MNTIEDLPGKAIAEARRLVGELRPIMTDEQTLAEAIARLIAEWGRRGELQVEFKPDIQPVRMNPLLQGNMFRIVQEALTNVKRHSRSKTAKVGLWQRNGTLLLEIEDHGVGFDPNEVPGGCFGLKGIRERARLFDGRASIQSAPGEGTRILVELPGIEASRKQTVA
ncbi:MAG: sensor histidine kinase [Planctomycetota bacterium]